MKYVYKFFGGRKIFLFMLILALNTWALLINKWVAEFGYFCVALYTSIVAGVEATKAIKGKFGSAKNIN